MSNPNSKAAAVDIEHNPPLSGNVRRWIYWITLVIVILIAAQTVMDVIGVHVFPRRSWSEGISPKVIQSSGGVLFHEYTAVRASDVQIEVPPGAQTTFLGIAAVVNPADPKAKILLRLMTIPEDLFLLVVVWLLRNMVLSTWSNPTTAVTPFIRANVWRLRWIATLIAALWTYHLMLPWLTEQLSLYTVLNGFGPVITEEPPWYFTNGSLGVALLLLILAEVFSHGVRLQKEVEGLV